MKKQYFQLRSLLKKSADFKKKKNTLKEYKNYTSLVNNFRSKIEVS